MAFSMYGMAVVVAPAIGPTLGGWITDNFNWHWIFFINLPVGLLSLFLTHRFVEDPPWLKKEKNAGISIDYIGLALIVIGVACFQIVLDKGQEEDWFGSPLITTMFSIGVPTLAAFFLWEWFHEHPIVDVRLLKNRNFGTAVFFSFTLGMVLFGSTVLIPEFLAEQPWVYGRARRNGSFAWRFGSHIDDADCGPADRHEDRSAIAGRHRLSGNGRDSSPDDHHLCRNRFPHDRDASDDSGDFHAIHLYSDQHA